MADQRVQALEDTIVWMATRVHQAYHVLEIGTWKECGVGVCAEANRVLGQENYDPRLDLNPDPRCDCIHPASEHDAATGRCRNANPVFGPCLCKGRE